jgi:hypothetical protein
MLRVARCSGRPQGAALGVLRDGRLTGYGVLRACRNGFKIGPLFADDEGAAKQLFLALAAQAPDSPVFLDVPEPDAAAIDLARRHNMKVVFETARNLHAGASSGPPGPLLRRYDT